MVPDLQNDVIEEMTNITSQYDEGLVNLETARIALLLNVVRPEADMVRFAAALAQRNDAVVSLALKQLGSLLLSSENDDNRALGHAIGEFVESPYAFKGTPTTVNPIQVPR